MAASLPTLFDEATFDDETRGFDVAAQVFLPQQQWKRSQPTAWVRNV